MESIIKKYPGFHSGSILRLRWMELAKMIRKWMEDRYSMIFVIALGAVLVLIGNNAKTKYSKAVLNKRVLNNGFTFIVSLHLSSLQSG
jgi:hypothetical protein